MEKKTAQWVEEKNNEWRNEMDRLENASENNGILSREKIKQSSNTSLLGESTYECLFIRETFTKLLRTF